MASSRGWGCSLSAIDERWRMRAFWMLADVFVFSGTVACGAAGDSEPPATKAASTHRPSPIRSHTPGRDQRAAEGGLLACASASVLLGDLPGAIDFYVRCRPRPGEQTVSFGVSGGPVDAQGKPGIRAFRHRPVVTGDVGSGTHGRCDAIAPGDIVCRARAERSVRISGRIWVNPETRCNFGVTISAARRRHCTSICSSDSIRVILASGVPRGC